MRSAALILFVLALGTVEAAEEQFTFIGTVDKAGSKEISIKTLRGLFKVYATDSTELLKDKTYHDFSPLKASDEISVRCQPDASGRLMAMKLWAKVVSFPATVKDLRGEEIEVVVTSASGDQRKIIRFYPDTVFGANRDDLAVGQRLRIVGLEVGDDSVDASRIALYNTDVPVRR